MAAEADGSGPIGALTSKSPGVLHCRSIEFELSRLDAADLKSQANDRLTAAPPRSITLYVERYCSNHPHWGGKTRIGGRSSAS